jgi:PII-like signaling protein
MLTKGKARKLVVYLTESDTRHGRPLYELLVELGHQHGLAGATVTRGILGFGAAGALHRAHPDLASKLPVRVEIVDTPEAIDRLLPDVYDLVDEGLVELSDVEVVKLKPRSAPAAAAAAGAAEAHVKLAGKAKMLRIFVEAKDQWAGAPLHEAILKRLRQLDVAGATVIHGALGYGATGRVHRHTALRHDEPVVLVVVDTAEKLAEVLPHLDHMIKDGMVVMSDVDVIFYRGAPAPAV